jgi:hypothetical protein
MGAFLYISVRCDGQNCSETIDSLRSHCLSSAPKAARALGWAVSRDRRKYYCPKCAPSYTRVGCRGFCKKQGE